MQHLALHFLGVLPQFPYPTNLEAFHARLYSFNQQSILISQALTVPEGETTVNNTYFIIMNSMSQPYLTGSLYSLLLYPCRQAMASILSPRGGDSGQEPTSALPINEQAMQLLNFSHKLDISLLDTVVAFFYSAVGEQVIPRCVHVCMLRLLLPHAHIWSFYYSCLIVLNDCVCESILPHILDLL